MKNGEKRYVAHLPFGTASKDINSAVFEIGRCLASRWKNCHELVTVMPEDKIITVQGLVCKKQLLAALIAAFISSLTRLHPFGHLVLDCACWAIALLGCRNSKILLSILHSSLSLICPGGQECFFGGRNLPSMWYAMSCGHMAMQKISQVPRSGVNSASPPISLGPKRLEDSLLRMNHDISSLKGVTNTTPDIHVGPDGQPLKFASVC